MSGRDSFLIMGVVLFFGFLLFGLTNETSSGTTTLSLQADERFFQDNCEGFELFNIRNRTTNEIYSITIETFSELDKICDNISIIDGNCVLVEVNASQTAGLECTNFEEVREKLNKLKGL